MKNTTLFLLFLIGCMSNYSFGQWNQIGQDMVGEASGDGFGISLDINGDGNIVAIGAWRNDGINGTDSGHVRVYENLNGVWTQLGDDLDGENADDRFGRRLSINDDGNIVAIGGYQNDENGNDSGHVRIYEYLNGVWTQIGDDIDGLIMEDSGFDLDLSQNGKIVIIGSRLGDGDEIFSGLVRVFEDVDGVWIQKGQTINGESTGIAFGHEVAINGIGTIILIGAHLFDGSNGQDSGYVQVYEFVNDSWVQLGEDIEGDSEIDHFGREISINNIGSIIAVSSPLHDGAIGTNNGKVKIYEYLSGEWIQKGQEIEGEASGDGFGEGLSLNDAGNLIAIGAYRNDSSGSSSGKVKVYEYSSGAWNQLGQDMVGEASEDRFGFSLGMNNDGNILAVGALQSNSLDSGYVRVFSNSFLSIEESNFQSKIRIYPNPTFEMSHILLGEIHSTVNLSVFNVNGQLIDENNYYNTDKLRVETKNFSPGIYVLHIKSDSQKAIIKLVKK